MEKKTLDLISKYENLQIGENVIITKYIGFFIKGKNKYGRHYFEKKCLTCGSCSNLTPGKIENYIKSNIGCYKCKGTLRIVNNVSERKCPCCNHWLPITIEYFGISKSRRFGLNYYCLNCTLTKNRKRREIVDNRKKECLQKKNRRKEDNLFRFQGNVRCLIKNTLFYRGYKKNSKTYKILGCSFEDFKTHIESKFELWMSWDNHGLYNGKEGYGWDIDHIIPVSLAKTEEDVIRLNHYSNLQPLCSYINRRVKKNLLWGTNVNDLNSYVTN